MRHADRHAHLRRLPLRRLSTVVAVVAAAIVLGPTSSPVSVAVQGVTILSDHVHPTSPTTASVSASAKNLQPNTGYQLVIVDQLYRTVAVVNPGPIMSDSAGEVDSQVGVIPYSQPRTVIVTFKAMNGLTAAKGASLSIPQQLSNATAGSVPTLLGPTTESLVLPAHRWSDPATWGGVVPATDAVVVVSKPILLDVDAAVRALTIDAGASLIFDPGASRNLVSAGNVVVDGLLVMRPASAEQRHRLVFANVDERQFMGGGDLMLPTDVGLWVLGAGRLDLSGTPKTAWLRTAGSVEVGAATLSLTAPPSGWAPGDDLAIAPTENPTVGAPSYEGFDETTLAAFSGTTVTLGRPTMRRHPVVNGAWTAEVMNLSRNVQVQGTPSGRSHIFIKSSRPQTINHTEIRWMGVNKEYDRHGAPLTGVLGRYSLHFHRSGDGTRGSVVDGTVIRDGGAQSYAAHESNGITFRNCISYNTYRSAFWWDPQTRTNDTTIDGCIAARVKYTEDAKYRLSGFVHDAGDRNVIRNSVAVGVASCGCDDDGAGFFWPEVGGGSEYSGVWGWHDNVSHNNRMNGLFVWQNTGVHPVRNLVAYYNGAYGIEHGAYVNSYHYDGGTLYGNGSGAVELEAVGPTRFDNMVMDGAGIAPTIVVTRTGNGEPTEPVTFANVTMRGAPRSFWLARAPLTGEGRDHADYIDVISSSLTGTQEFYLENSVSARARIRVQTSDTTYEVRRGDQPGGTYVPAWNAVRRTISRFPTATVTSPSHDTRVTGTITITADTTSQAAIARVEFYRDGGAVATDNTAPYSASLDTRTMADGSHSIQVKPYDTSGHAGPMAGVTISVKNN